MTITVAALHVALLAVSAAITVGLAVYAWRNHAEPGARPFAGLMLAVTVWTAGYLFGLATRHPQWRLLWENVQWLGIVFVPVFFLAFALAYTGYDELLSRRSLGLLSVLPLLTVGLTWTNASHGLVWAETRVVVVDGIALAVQEFGPWFWVNLLYTYALVGVGSLLLLRLVFLSDYLYVDQSALLLVGVAVPVVGNAVSIFGPTPYPGMDLVPYAFTVTGLAFGYAMFRHRLFELVPATRQLGRDAAITYLDDGVVIVDTERRVVYLNPAAAEVFECDPREALGEPVRSLAATGELDFEAEDALAEFERGGRTYEIRSSPIFDQHDRQLGNTLVVHDVTSRKRRERTLKRQREELRTVNQINEVIRGINQALVGATTREEIETAVCERLAASELYRAAWAGQGVLAEGTPVQWTTAAGEAFDAGEASTADASPADRSDADGTPPAASPPVEHSDAEGTFAVAASSAGHSDADEVPSAAASSVEHFEGAPDDLAPMAGTGAVGADRGRWTTVPVVYGQMVYGVLVVFTDRLDAFADEELAILGELGETVGLAISAIENRKLLQSDAVVELELSCTDPSSVLADVSGRADCTISQEGLVVAAEDRLLAYQTVEGAPPDRVRELASEAAAVETAQVIDEGDDGGLVELVLTADSLVGTLTGRGANVTDVSADGGDCRVVAEVAPGTDVRQLVELLQGSFPETRLLAKRELDRPVENVETIPGAVVEDLTDRQRQAVEAAYFAGYFEWPRDSTAEEVAESMDVSAPTFYNHLRKAQNKLLAEIVDRETAGGRLDDARRSERS